MKIKGNAGVVYTRSVVLAFIGMAINYAISLVLTPYITETMGAEAYGFVTLAKTVANYGVIITTCLNAFAGRFITIAYHNREFDRANQYFSTVVLTNVGLLLAVMAGSGLFLWKIESFLVVPQSMLRDVRILFALDILNFMLLTTVHIYGVYATVKDKQYLGSLVRMLGYLAEIAVLFVLFLCLEPRIYYVGVSLLASTAVLGIMHYSIAKREIPELRVRLRSFSPPAIKKLVGSGIWSTVNQVGNLLNSGLDLWVSNLMLSATSMGQISVVKTLTTIFATLYQMLAGPLHPRLLKQYSAKDTKGVMATFSISMKINGFIGMLLFAGFLAFGRIYYQLWTPSQDITLLYELTMITFAGSIVEAISYPLFYTYTLTLKNRVPCFITILSGLLNVGGMYLMIRFLDMGAYAVVLTTTVLGWGTYLVFTPIYAAKCMGGSPKIYYKAIARIFGVGILMTAAVWLVSRLFQQVSWLALIAGAMVSAVVCLPIYFFGAFTRQERVRIMNLIPFKVRKGK